MDLTRFVFNELELKRLASSNSEVGVYTRFLAGEVQEQAKANIASGASGIRERTGELGRSIELQRDTDGHGFFVDVGSDLPRSTYLEEGTSPHPIVARRARVLRSAADHPDPLRFPTQAVFHPGNQPMSFLRLALEDVIGRA